MIVFCGLSPHPPLLVPTIGKDRIADVAKSAEALDTFAQQLKETKPETMVIISPHSPFHRHKIGLNGDTKLYGDLRNFGDTKTRVNLNNDLTLVDAIMEECTNFKLATYKFSEDLDHAVIVPLYYILKGGFQIPTVQVGIADLDFENLSSFGKAVKNASFQLKKRVAVIASGDMSHRLTADAPAGYDPYGKIFDRQIAEILAQGDFKKIKHLPEELIYRAGECGLRSITMMSGALDGISFRPQVLSYEGPFGVGYLTATFIPN